MNTKKIINIFKYLVIDINTKMIKDKNLIKK